MDSLLKRVAKLMTRLMAEEPFDAGTTPACEGEHALREVRRLLAHGIDLAERAGKVREGGRAIADESLADWPTTWSQASVDEVQRRARVLRDVRLPLE